MSEPAASQVRLGIIGTGAIRGEHPARLGRADALGQARTRGALYGSAAQGRLVRL